MWYVSCRTTILPRLNALFSTDELFKSAGFLTEAYYLSPQRHKNGREPTRAPFNHAFGYEGIGFFGWLEGEGIDGKHVHGSSRDEGLIPGVVAPVNGAISHKRGASSIGKKADIYSGQGNSDNSVRKFPDPLSNPNRFRLERFGKAMTGTEYWEAPGAVLNGTLSDSSFSLNFSLAVRLRLAISTQR